MELSGEVIVHFIRNGQSEVLIAMDNNTVQQLFYLLFYYSTKNLKSISYTFININYFPDNFFNSKLKKYVLEKIEEKSQLRLTPRRAFSSKGQTLKADTLTTPHARFTY